MKKKDQRKSEYEGTVLIYIESTNIDLHSPSLIIKEHTVNCPDLPSIIEKNKQKFSKAWETLAKR